MFARLFAVVFALVLALGVTAQVNPDSWVLNPGTWFAAAQEQGSTSQR